MKVRHDAGPILDSLGVKLNLLDGEQVVEALVVCKVVDFSRDATPGLIVASSTGLDWITQLGLLNAALKTHGPRIIPGE